MNVYMTDCLEAKTFSLFTIMNNRQGILTVKIGQKNHIE